MATPRRRVQKKTPPSQKSEVGVAREFYDPKMEFDAPMYRDFNSQTPDNHIDDWFETRRQQITNKQYLEPKYSPITLQTALDHSKRQKARTPSTRKAKKVMGMVPEVMEEIPKMSLEEVAEDVPRAGAEAKKSGVAASTRSKASAPAEISKLPAVPVSVLGKLPASTDMKPFVVAAPVPLPVLPAKVAGPQSETKAEEVVLHAVRAIQKPTLVAPPIRKRTMWVKPDMPAAKPRDLSPPKNAVVSTAASSLQPEQVRPPTTALSSKTFASTLASKTPAPKTLAAKASTVSKALASKTPAVTVKKERSPAQRPAVRKATIPVAPRCYTINTRSQAQPLTRSQTVSKPASKFNPRSLTIPKEFSFMKGREPANKRPKAEVVPEKVKDMFPSLLRADSDPPPRQPHGLTRPVEFHFATDARAKGHAMQHPADLDLEAAHASKGAVEGMRSENGLTLPVEFKFATSKRARANMGAEPAQPSKRPTYADSKPAAPRPRMTVPQAFNLSKSNRVPEPAPLVATRAKSKPVTQQELRAARKLTVPVTPLVATRKRKTPEKVPEEVVPFKARPAPQAAPFVPAEASRPLTVAEPFDLITDVRGAEKADRLRRQEEEDRQREAEARVFVAQPLPAMDAPSGVPMVEPPPLTVFEPFDLQSEPLSLYAKQRLEQKILAERALEEEMRKFKANPPVTLSRPPFLPLSSNRPLTVAETPDLKSTVRAVDRAEFSVDKNQRIAIKEDREQQDKILEESNEREEIRKLRKTLVFKAAPFVNPSPMRLAPATRPLNVPESPQLRTSLRSMR